MVMLVCLLPIIVGFSYIYVSQSSVATQLRCGGIFNNRLLQMYDDDATKITEFIYSLNCIARYCYSCDKDIRARLGKANGVFGRLTNIWRDNGLSLHTQIRLYEALVLSTLLYGAETWSMSVSNTKKLEAAHHRWQGKILKISWKDMITNKTVRETTGQDTLESVIRERRLRWFGHVYRMDSNRIARQPMD